MKLAEALMQRGDCQKRLEQLKQRIVGNAKVQEGDDPAEDPTELLTEMEKVAVELMSLIQRINKTNSATSYDADNSLSDALAERDVIMARRAVYSDLAKSASVVQARTSRSEVKFKSTVSVAAIQTKIDELSKAYREVDSRIQQLNWQIELAE